MGLDDKVRGFWRRNKEFTIASVTYIAASGADYLATAIGISNKWITESNPLIREYMNVFGLHAGLLIPKVALGAGVLFLMKQLDNKHRENKTSVKAEYILYPAAFLTAVTGSSWYLIEQITKYF